MENNGNDFSEKPVFLNEKILEFRKDYQFTLSAEECREETKLGIAKIKAGIADEKNRFLYHCEKVIKSARAQGEYDLYLDIQRTTIIKDFVYVEEYIEEVMEIIRRQDFTVRKEEIMFGKSHIYISWKKD